jgi:hypothetical protein
MMIGAMGISLVLGFLMVNERFVVFLVRGTLFVGSAIGLSSRLITKN